MSFLLIRNETASRKAVIWIGVINEKSFDVESLSIGYNGGNLSLNQNRTSFTTRSTRNSIFYQFPKVANLDPQTDYFFGLRSGERIFTNCRVPTLPECLPTVDEKPFTVLFGSCFCRSRKNGSALAADYRKHQNKEKINLKILCGDQVYLDDPTSNFSTLYSERSKRRS